MSNHAVEVSSKACTPHSRPKGQLYPIALLNSFYCDRALAVSLNQPRIEVRRKGTPICPVRRDNKGKRGSRHDYSLIIYRQLQHF